MKVIFLEKPKLSFLLSHFSQANIFEDSATIIFVYKIKNCQFINLLILLQFYSKNNNEHIRAENCSFCIKC